MSLNVKLLSQTGVPCTPIDPGHSERERLETRDYYAFVSCGLVDGVFFKKRQKYSMHGIADPISNMHTTSFMIQVPTTNDLS